MDTLAGVAAPEAIAAAAVRHSCRSVAYTYNDPVIFLEYAVDVAQACRERGVLSVAVTAGYINALPRREFFRFMDAANVDLKAFSASFYKKLCSADLATVQDTLRYVRHETNVWLEITTLLIPGENDSDAELDAMTRWIERELHRDIPLHFTAFHPDYNMRDHAATPASTLTRARRIAMNNGLRYVYTGNVRDVAGASTLCPSCGCAVIARDGYSIIAWNLDARGCCARCGTSISGRFAPTPGTWGSRRLPVTIGV